MNLLQELELNFKLKEKSNNLQRIIRLLLNLINFFKEKLQQTLIFSAFVFTNSLLLDILMFQNQPIKPTNEFLENSPAETPPEQNTT